MCARSFASPGPAHVILPTIWARIQQLYSNHFIYSWGAQLNLSLSFCIFLLSFHCFALYYFSQVFFLRYVFFAWTKFFYSRFVVYKAAVYAFSCIPLILLPSRFYLSIVRVYIHMIYAFNSIIYYRVTFFFIHYSRRPTCLAFRYFMPGMSFSHIRIFIFSIPRTVHVM